MRSKPARGRPRLFDEDVVLDKIANVFWEKGFAGTSIDDLTEAAGIKRPSLYASFGDKKASFYAALAHSRRRLDALIKEFEEAENLRLGLAHFSNKTLPISRRGRAANEAALS
jgi:AcrR family transcriptional regulator